MLSYKIKGAQGAPCYVEFLADQQQRTQRLATLATPKEPIDGRGRAAPKNRIARCARRSDHFMIDHFRSFIYFSFPNLLQDTDQTSPYFYFPFY